MHNAEECGLDMAIYIWNGPIEPKNELNFQIGQNRDVLSTL